MLLILKECTKLSFTSSPMFIILLLGLIIMISPLVLKIIKTIIIKKRTELTVTIKEAKENNKVTSEGKITYGYYLTCEYEYNGEKKKKVMLQSYRYKPGTKIKALYNPKKDSLLLKHNGFYILNPGTWILPFLFGALLIFISVVSTDFCFVERFIHIKEFNFHQFYEIVAVSVLVLVIIGMIIQKKDANRNKNNETKAHPMVKDLVRYIPEYKSKDGKKEYKMFFPDLLIIITFGLAGLILSILGILSVIMTMYIKIQFPTTYATIKTIYKYEVNDSYETGVIYTYINNNEEITIDEETGIGYGWFNYEEGDKIKIYYDEKDPNEAAIKTKTNLPFIILLMGLLFSYVAIKTIKDNNRDKRLYRMYSELEGKKK